MSALLSMVIGASSATAVTSCFTGLVVRLLKRVANDAVREGIREIGLDLTNLKLKIATEVGGNSNGLRQKVNEVDSKVDAIALDVAHMKGALGQPTIVNNNAASPPAS